MFEEPRAKKNFHRGFLFIRVLRGRIKGGAVKRKGV
jgi:hypothetical protein